MSSWAGRTVATLWLVACLFRGSTSARGEDWPMFGRDSTRNAVSPEKNPPVRWQVEERQDSFLLRPAWNVKWETRIGSAGFASPVVADGLVWIGTNNQRPRDPKVKGDAAVLMCFRASDGRFLWQYVSRRLDNLHQDWPHAGMNCSPLAEGNRLYFTTNRAEVVCLDIGPLRQGQGEPREVWKLDMRKQLGVSPRGAAMNVGYTCSLGASYQGRIYVTTGNGVGEDDKTVPAPHAPSLLCLDKETGKVLWSDNSPGKNILHDQWSSPLVVEVKGRGQVIAGQGDGWIRSFDALTGKPIWRFDTNPKGAKWNDGRGPRSYPIATPVYREGRIYLANGRAPENGPGPGRLWCIDASQEGDVSAELDAEPGKGKPNPNSAAVWCFERGGEKDENQMHDTLSSVAVHDGLAIAPTVDGYVHCLDARTGRTHWTYDARSEISASPLIADGKIYIADADGMVTILALSKKLKRIASNDMGPPLASAPVLANSVLYLATSWKLYAIQTGPDGKSDRAPGYWPQWRGPARTGISPETGLLKKWPDRGPPLAWKAQGLGEGVATVAVARDRVYTLGYREGDEYLTALEEATGKKIWATNVGPAIKENPSMRWLSQRTPTVDGDRLYAFRADGILVCLKSADGKEIWRKNYARDFEGKAAAFGWCDRPLVDGDRLICTPGGARNTVVALNKINGELDWKCEVPGGSPAGYSAAVVADAGGVRQYVAFLHRGVVGISARDGKLLWQYEKISNGTANNYTPLVSSNHVFCASGYGAGMALLKLLPEKESVRAEEIYFQKLALPPWHDTTILVGQHVYAGTNSDLACIELATGKILWRNRGAVGGRVSVACADSHLYLRSQEGKVALVEATSTGYELKGVLSIPGAVAKAGSTAPVIAGGRLYLRDDDVLFSYDVMEEPPDRPVPPIEPDPTGPSTRPKEGRQAHDVFVPTPQDVVEKMLELAKVKREDVVYDLGCGDGRIVVTAARKYGCKAVGYDIDPECVRMSRESVKMHDVGRLVTIEQKDIFTVDLSKADVIALYLLPSTMERLAPQLTKLKPGVRIVTHAFAFPGVRPDNVETVRSTEDELPHKIHVWTTPLKRADPEK